MRLAPIRRMARAIRFDESANGDSLLTVLIESVAICGPSVSAQMCILNYRFKDSPDHFAL